MAERHQHCRFIGGDLLQTRRDQSPFNKKTASDSTACFAKKGHPENGLNVFLYCYTMRKVNALQIFIKTAAVSGIAFFWANFTVESLKLAWHIISTSPETCQPIVKVMCESCYGYFLDDGGELIDGKFLCESCSIN